MFENIFSPVHFERLVGSKLKRAMGNKQIVPVVFVSLFVASLAYIVDYGPVVKATKGDKVFRNVYFKVALFA